MPFGEYKDFDECVSKNSDKKNPKAYCAKIQKKVEEATVRDYPVTAVMDISEAVFEDVDGRMMATVRILKAGKSKNNRVYRPAAVKEAVEKKLFDGVRMFVNHDRDRPPIKRSYHDMVSAIESTSYDESAQAADARVVFFDRPFYEKAQAAKKYMGSSINALVRGTRRPVAGGAYEEDISEIVHPRSVDWVIYPAAGGEILAFEDYLDEGDDMPVDWEKISLEDIKEHAPHIVEALEAEREPAPPPEPPPTPEPDPEPEPLPTTRAALESIVQEAVTTALSTRSDADRQKEVVAGKVREQVKTSGLPEKTRARVIASFESMTEFDEKKVKKSIEAAKEELAAAGVGPQIRGNGPSKGTVAAGARSFSVKESVESHFGVKPGSTDGDDSKEGAK